MAPAKALTGKPDHRSSLIPGIHIVEKKTNSSNYDFYTYTTWNVLTPNHKVSKILNKKDPIGLLVLCDYKKQMLQKVYLQ